MSRISASFLVLAVILDDSGIISEFDIDAGNRSGSWVGGNDRVNQCWGGRGGNRLDIYVGNAGSWIECAQHAQGAGDGGGGSSSSSDSGGGGDGCRQLYGVGGVAAASTRSPVDPEWLCLLAPWDKATMEVFCSTCDTRQRLGPGRRPRCQLEPRA